MLHAEKVKPFDFVVEEQLVREPLQSLVTSLGISAVCICRLSLQHASVGPYTLRLQCASRRGSAHSSSFKPLTPFVSTAVLEFVAEDSLKGSLFVPLNTEDH